jgi:16S rRNA (uracil1498-N3)-methyltransferase
MTQYELAFSQLQRIAIAPNQFNFPQIALTPEQQHYLTRVLRLHEGDRFIAMNACGDGQWWLSELHAQSSGAFDAIVQETIDICTELSVPITLIAALPKGNGFDDVVRAATELGVTCILPTIGDRTLLQPSANKLDRWRRIATEAAEQSERQAIPEILEPIAFSTAVAAAAAAETRNYLCVTRRDAPHLLTLTRCVQDDWPIAIATGPEGGWTEAEIDAALAAGFQPVSLGRRIFRAVTAPIVALSMIAGSVEIS